MNQEEKTRRAGPSTYALSFSGVIALAGLVASGVATYNSLQNDIAVLKRGEMYQQEVNKQLREDLYNYREEQRATMGEFHSKLDRIAEIMAQRRR